MSTADHADESGDRSPASVATIAIVGIVLIAVVTGAFWLIGRTGGDEPPVIGAPAEQDTEESTPQETAPETPAADPSPTEPNTPGPSPDVTPTLTASPTEAGTEGAQERSEITVQVLDAAGDDGSAAEDAAGRLRELGYQVVAVNRAVRTYESSTLFYTEDHEPDARLIAEDLTQFDVVDEAPDNLSSSVDVHAVVGQDWFAPGD